MKFNNPAQRTGICDICHKGMIHHDHSKCSAKRKQQFGDSHENKHPEKTLKITPSRLDYFSKLGM